MNRTPDSDEPFTDMKKSKASLITGGGPAVEDSIFQWRGRDQPSLIKCGLVWQNSKVAQLQIPSLINLFPWVFIEGLGANIKAEGRSGQLKVVNAQHPGTFSHQGLGYGRRLGEPTAPWQAFWYRSALPWCRKLGETGGQSELPSNPKSWQLVGNTKRDLLWSETLTV